MENTPQKMVKTGAEKLGNRTSTVREINDLVAPVEPKDGTTYGDMTVAEYNSVIATRERIAANYADHKWEQREVEEAEKDIARQEERIAEKRAEFEESVKVNKERMKKAKKALKKANGEIAENNQRAKEFLRHAEDFRNMRDRFTQEDN